MKLNGINLVKTYCQQNLKLKSSEKSQFEEKQQTLHSIPVSFWGIEKSMQSCGYRKPKIMNESLKKVFYFVKVLPNSSRITQPREILLNNEKFAYTISKDTTGRAELLIKNKVASLEDWQNKAKDKKRTILKCTFDPKGMLVGGSLTNYYDKKNKVNATFKHIGQDGRRLVINDEIYRPINNDSSKWSKLPKVNSRVTKEEYDLSSMFEQDSIINSLIELATNRTSLQLLER